MRAALREKNVALEERPDANSTARSFFWGPGSGKSTQAKSWPRRYGIPHFRPGTCCGACSKVRRSALQAKPIMERGELVPDSLVLKMVAERIERPDCSTHLCSTVFRGRDQAKYLGEL